MRLGLRGRFVVFVSAVIIAFGAIVTALAVRIQNDRLRHELTERSKLLATVAAANAANSLALLQVDDLRRMIAEIRQQEHVVDAYVFDENGRIMTDGSLKNPRRHTLVSDAVRTHTASSEALLVEPLTEGVRATKPVAVGSQLLGGVTILYSFDGLAQAQSLFARRTSLVGAAFVVLAVLATAVLAGAVTRPLAEITAAARAIAGGRPAPVLPVRTSDEVGELAAAFNEMSRQLRETTVSRDELDLILETMAEGLVVTSVDGTIQRANKAACELAVSSEASLVGHNVRRLFRPPSGYQSLLQASQPNGVVHGLDTAILTTSGGQVPVLVSIAALSEPGERPRGYVIVAADLSERLRIEQQKDEFVTMVHHEVRAPLTAVRGAIGLLSGGVGGELPASARELVEIAQRNSERMERLVGDILTARKLDAGRMEFQLVEADPTILVHQALETTSPYAEKYDVRFVFEGDFGGARVAVDPDRYIQVLNNVLSNAVRFSPKDGIITVTAGISDGVVRVAVRDQGPGIDDEFRDQVFEKFARADDGAWRHRSGTGLGMSISKAIMDELGGSIWFQTEKGSGTTFFVDLPEVH